MYSGLLPSFRSLRIPAPISIYFSCSKNAGIRATNVAGTRHTCFERKLERIDLKRRKSPLDGELSYHFVRLILQRKQLTRDSLLSLLQDQGRLALQGFSVVQEMKLKYLYLYLRSTILNSNTRKNHQVSL